MAKFYCKSGDFEIIMSASDKNEAGHMIANILLNSRTPHMLFFTISERGMDSTDCVAISLVPFFRETGVQLPSDDILIYSACESLGLRTLSKKQVDWLLKGGEIE